MNNHSQFHPNLVPSPKDDRDASLGDDQQMLSEPAVISSKRMLVREMVEVMLLTLLLFWVVNAVIGRFKIDGPSMLPTLHTGEFIFVNRLAYYLDQPVHGEIVVVNSPDGTKDFIKRVVGVAGDTVEIEAGVVKVNGVVLNELYLDEATSYSGIWQVPEHHVFVLGDNRNVSYDSHYFGAIRTEAVVGKALYIYWPPADVGQMPHYYHDLSTN